MDNPPVTGEMANVLDKWDLCLECLETNKYRTPTFRPISPKNKNIGKRKICNMNEYTNRNSQEIVRKIKMKKPDQHELLNLANMYDGNPEPKNYFEAKISNEWKNWKEAMYTEFKNMEDKKVWKIYNRDQLHWGRVSSI